MFGIWRRKKPTVLKHWFSAFQDFNISTETFYADIQALLEAQQVPGLFLERIMYAEGGLLSAKREYLRMRRERLVFDVCAAPLGSNWFFSCRFSEIPYILRWWELLLVLLFLGAIELFYALLFGWTTGTIILFTSVIGVAMFMRNLVALGLSDLDAALLQLPVVGAIYETFIRKETYFREDTRHVYIDVVDKIVRSNVEKVAHSKGVQLVQFQDVTPPSHPAILSLIASLLRSSP